jgi:alginate O-acetyltransferase complex protein AlgI
MLFVSHEFIDLFLPATIAAFYLTHRILPILCAPVLLVASVFFCAYNGLQQGFLLLSSIIFNFCLGVGISAVASQRRDYRKMLLCVGIAVNLMVLGYYKYAGFIIANINLLLNTDYNFVQPSLPLGISFYTFTQIAFLADVYFGKGPSRFRLLDYALFVTYFPHLVAGPIIHWREMIPQFAGLGKLGQTARAAMLQRENICRGIILFSIGLAKKLFLADQFAPLVNQGYSAVERLGCIDAWLLSLSYTFQLYFDFSGYSDMAVGMSLVFGITLPFNFDGPYRAVSVQDFWRRWHMTLSRWLRDYIFIPLGGSRGSVITTARNILITFLLGGIWHGAAWTFVIWGALHGVALCVQRLWANSSIDTPRIISVILTFLFVNAAWVFFRAPDVSTSLNVLGAMLSPNRLSQTLNPDYWPLVLVGFAMVWFLPTSQYVALQTRIGTSLLAASSAGALIVVAMVAQNAAPPSPFLYFNF